jgi:alkylation response protein AidB-like acyl-CoA dehydrogenase
MQLMYSAEDEAFRTELRAWLRENLPAGWMDAVDRGDTLEMAAEDRKAFNEAWPQRLFEGGWICATWPKEYGGKGLTTMQGVVLAEEFARAKAPMRGDFFGDTLVGPTLL